MKIVARTSALALLMLTGCVAPTGPVEVTRFHTPETARLGVGTIAIEPAVGQDGSSLEFRSYAAAVSRELQRVGYSEVVAGSRNSESIATVSIIRESFQHGRDGSPVSVGVGVGIGFDLSGPPPEEVATRLSVTIRERASGKALWEGRASFSARASSPLAQTQLGAPKLAEALFRNFPGTSGETILVK